MKDKFSFSISYSDLSNRVKGVTILCNKEDFKEAIDKAEIKYGIDQRKILGIISNKK